MSGWAEDSLVKGYLVAEHKVVCSEILRKEVSKSSFLVCGLFFFFFFFPNPLLIRGIRLIVGMAVLCPDDSFHSFVLTDGKYQQEVCCRKFTEKQNCLIPC